MLLLLRKTLKAKWVPPAIVTLWPAALAVGMGSYDSRIPTAFFKLGYALSLAAVVLSVGRFFESQFLSNRRTEARRRNSSKGAKRRYKSWQIVFPILVFAFGAFLVVLIQLIETKRELFEMKGILVSANEPDQPGPCDSFSQDGKLKLLAGGITVPC